MSKDLNCMHLFLIKMQADLVLSNNYIPMTYKAIHKYRLIHLNIINIL